MFSKLFGANKPYKEIEITSEDIEFLGEPSGSDVAVLKIGLAKILMAEGNTSAAYVSRVRYKFETEIRLALVIDGRAAIAQMAETIAQACKPLVAIDILFLNTLKPIIAQKLRKAVPQFYPAKNNNQFFMINVQIGRGKNTEMPNNLAGAYVPIFVAAPDSETAALEAVKQLNLYGYDFIEISDKKIHQLDPTGWDAYIKTAWYEFEEHFPSQEDVIAGLPYGQIFFGPFAGYEAQNP